MMTPEGNGGACTVEEYVGAPIRGAVKVIVAAEVGGAMLKAEV